MFFPLEPTKHLTRVSKPIRTGHGSHVNQTLSRRRSPTVACSREEQKKSCRVSGSSDGGPFRGPEMAMVYLELRCRAHNAYEAEQYYGHRWAPPLPDEREKVSVGLATRSGPGSG